jgi:hypothetical protein
MKTLVAGMALLVMPGLVIAGPLDSIAGRYRYEQYSVTLPSGQVLGLADLGATEAFLDISDAAGTITLRMTMRAGNIVVQTAKVVDASVTKGKGYWMAQWPDMSYPVRAVLTVSAGVLTTETRFDNRADVERFGSMEHAVLRSVSAGRP